MSRQPHEIANINLRIRETLRRKIQRAAEQHHFSLNNEIRIRLEDSLTRDATYTLDDMISDLRIKWARQGERDKALEFGDQLAAAVLARDGWENIAQLARLWQQHRARELRINLEIAP
jgi:hypothetical protein